MTLLRSDKSQRRPGERPRKPKQSGTTRIISQEVLKWKILFFYRQKNIKTIRTSKKLDYCFLGLFKIEKRIGNQAYRLTLPQKYGRIYNVFYVSLLEPYHQRAGEKPVVTQPDLVDENKEYEVEQILARRIQQKRNEWLVRQVGYGPVDDQWLTEEDLEGCLELVQEFDEKYPEGKLGSKQTAKKRKKSQPAKHQ